MTRSSHMNTPPLLHILWDESHIWGLMAIRAARIMGVPFRLARGREIAAGLLTRERPSLLLAPGGSARHKAESLGSSGIHALRDFVERGGRYLGFCGGAGLALTWDNDQASPSGGGCGLGLCPWQRAHFDDRMQHFMSGHLHVAMPESVRNDAGRHLIPDALLSASPGALPRLPVWWPGRFSPDRHGDTGVLAVYEGPASDFWLADLAISDLPPDTFSVWRDMYGVNFSPTFLAGQPCVVHGRFGKGEFVLSYSHLETPDSPQANIWLAHLLRVMGGLDPVEEYIPPWQPETGEAVWDDPALAVMAAQLEEIYTVGFRHGLLFARTDWLMGWRTGIPGAALNNLRATVRAVRERAPGNRALGLWRERRDVLLRAVTLFSQGCVQYLLAERLAMTLAKYTAETVPQAMLKNQREALFGPPMRAGGLYREIMASLDELAFLSFSGGSDS